MHKIGILSDTHNVLRPEVLEKLQGCERILHAGDVSSPKILEELKKIAPVTAVRGNNDRDWADPLPELEQFTICGVTFAMAHIKGLMPQNLPKTDFVISGHTHKYSAAWKGNTFYLNPGSCGPRLPHQEITMCLLYMEDDGSWNAEKIIIPHDSSRIRPYAKGRSAKTAGEMETTSPVNGAKKETTPEEVVSVNLGAQLPQIMADINAGKTAARIARKYQISEELAEAICRMYLTHPGVDADGILRRLGI